MRETAEPGDDVAMCSGIGDHVVRPHSLEQGHAAVLGVEVFGMFERHKKPHGHRWRQFLVIPPADPAPRQAEGLAIGGEGERIAPVDIARHLVEQDDETQRALRRLAPMVESASPRLLQSPAEAHRDRSIKSRIPGEPTVFASADPEIHHRPRRHDNSVCFSMKVASAVTSSRSNTGTGASAMTPLAAMATTVGSSPASFG